MMKPIVQIQMYEFNTKTTYYKLDRVNFSISPFLRKIIRHFICIKF